MSWSSSVDAYCERTDPGWWAEPLNATTNIAFLIAGLLLWRSLASAHATVRKPSAEIGALPWLLGLIGVCSFLFHTFATLWAGLVDQLAILLFACVFLYAFLLRAAEASAAASFAAVAAFSMVSYFLPKALPDAFLNHSAAYFPYLAGLIGMAVYLKLRGAPAWRGFALGTGLFCVSLALRTIDQAVCATFPWGTHFLWHLMNASLLLILARALTRATS